MQIVLSNQEAAQLKNDLLEAKIDCLQSCPSYPVVAVELTDIGGKLKLLVEYAECRGLSPRLVQIKWDDRNKTWSINWDAHPLVCKELKDQIDPEYLAESPRLKDCTHLTESALRSYWHIALWSSTDNSTESGGDPLDKNYTMSDVDDGTIAKSVQECDQFLVKCNDAGLLEDALCFYDLENIMQHFWLTRNQTGAGFWEGDYGDVLGDGLTTIADSFGEVDLYVGDDGAIYSL
jgi:hypothetical protein